MVEPAQSLVFSFAEAQASARVASQGSGRQRRLDPVKQVNGGLTHARLGGGACGAGEADGTRYTAIGAPEADEIRAWLAMLGDNDLSPE
jgi:hypothetical protein